MLNINKRKFNKKKKRSISPLIATILLVVVAVVLVTVVLNWGKGVTNSSLDNVQKIRTYEKSDAKYYTYFDSSKNVHGSVYLYWDPPNVNDQNINLIGFRLVEDPEMPIYYLDEQHTMKQGANLIPLGIMDNDFDLELYFDNNTMFLEEDLHMNFPANLSANDCPDGYVPVPGNTLYGTSSFCVMKYEAKVDETGDGIGDTNTNCKHMIFSTWQNDTSTCSYTENNREIVSSTEGYPLAYITQTEAKAACNSIGEGYYLITNEEWMTIARNIERQPANWTGGSLGSGVIKRGNAGSCEGCYDASSDPDYGTDRNELAKLVLSNGSSIWDISGNVSEWNDKIIQEQYEPQPSGSKSWFEDEITDYGPEGRKAYTPLNLDYNIDHGIGFMYTSYNSGSTTERAFRRGGRWYYGASAGPFAVSLSSSPGGRYYYIGFRCSVVPS